MLVCTTGARVSSCTMSVSPLRSTYFVNGMSMVSDASASLVERACVSRGGGPAGEPDWPAACDAGPASVATAHAETASASTGNRGIESLLSRPGDDALIV